MQAGKPLVHSWTLALWQFPTTGIQGFWTDVISGREA